MLLLARLTRFDHSSYAYDANGNRTRSSHSASGQSSTLSTATGSNRLASINRQAVPTDAAGNITARANTPQGTISLLHDPAGRVSAVQTHALQTTHYLHNAQGQRTFKSSATANSAPPALTGGTVYVHDESGQLLGEYGANQSSETIWLPSSSGAIPVALVHNGQTYAIEADHLNTPRRLSNAQNQTIWQWGYSGFGEEEPHSTPEAPRNFHFNLRYPGQIFDAESGLFYNWHRSYDPSTGRYTQPDPIGLAGGWNRFAYVQNNPIWAVDPEGLQVRVPVAVPLPLPVSGGALGVSNADLLMEEVGSGGRDRLGSRSRPERVARADGDCTPSYRRYLQDSVDRLCKPNPGSCHSNDSCAEAIAKEAMHTACADARKKINDICYRGGDRGHQIEYAFRRQQAMVCRGFMVK